MKNWTNEEIEILKNEYPLGKNIKYLKSIFSCSERTIRGKASELGLFVEDEYTKEEIEFIQCNYLNTKYENIAQSLGRTFSSVSSKIGKLKLNKSVRWSQEELNILKENYSKENNKTMLELLPRRKIYNIMNMAKKLGLKKIIRIEKKYSKKYLLEVLINLAKNIRRTPLAKDLVLNGLPSSATYKRCFGGYENALIEAGLSLNSSMYGKSIKCFSIVGDICNSMSEKIVTDFLINNHIPYKKEVKYSEVVDDSRCGHKTIDWFIYDKYAVEYFGLSEKKDYQKRMKEKRKICRDNGLPLIELYRKDLKNLGKKLFIID